MGGVNALSLGCYDEAASIPSEHAAKQSLRVQQILLHESNVANVVDPLAGSYFVESLTNELEQKTWEYIERIEDMGGWCKTIRNGYIKSDLESNAYGYSREIWEGKRVIVGANKFQEEEEAEIELGHQYKEDEQEIIERVNRFKKNRNQAQVDRALANLRDVALDDAGDMTPKAIEAAKVGATLGEICGIYKEVFGWEVW